MLRILLLVSLLCSSVVFAQKDAEKKYRKAGESHMVFMDSGSVHLRPMTGDVDVPLDYLTNPGEFKVGAFYISAYEVSNFDYLEYVYWLNREDHENYKAALPDTTVWEKKPYYSQAYLEYYFRHPAYRYYPVVGVTHQQALDFCAWLTDRYNANPERKHKTVRFRLPTKTEWTYAALSGAEYQKPEKGKSLAIAYKAYNSFFPWPSEVAGGNPFSMQDEDGDWMANFRPMDQASVRYLPEATMIYDSDTITNNFYIGWPGHACYHVPGSLSDCHDVTTPVYSYLPGLSGLYQMAGNVEEMVAEYGITKGGSWNDTGYYLQNTTEETYDASGETTCFRGFRLAMDVIEEF